MSTRDSIIATADALIRDKGFNGFSFKDISNSIGIKTASIHYHFPTKTSLGLALIRDHIHKLENLREQLKNQSALAKLEGFLSIYSTIKSEDKVCLVGSLATGINAIDEELKSELKVFAELVLGWVVDILKEGRTKEVFQFNGTPRVKAMMIISSMMAMVQLSRLTESNDFKSVKDTIIKELTQKKIK